MISFPHLMKKKVVSAILIMMTTLIRLKKEKMILILKMTTMKILEILVVMIRKMKKLVLELLPMELKKQQQLMNGEILGHLKTMVLQKKKIKTLQRQTMMKTVEDSATLVISTKVPKPKKLKKRMPNKQKVWYQMIK